MAQIPWAVAHQQEGSAVIVHCWEEEDDDDDDGEGVLEMEVAVSAARVVAVVVGSMRATEGQNPFQNFEPEDIRPTSDDWARYTFDDEL